MYSRDGSAAIFVVYGLPQLPAGQLYQLWLIHDGQRDSGGLFAVDDEGYAVLLIHAPRQLGQYQGLGVTNEPASGSPAPTGTRVLTGKL